MRGIFSYIHVYYLQMSVSRVLCLNVILLTVICYVSFSLPVKRQDGPIRIVITLKNIWNWNIRMARLATMFDSVLRRASTRPLHWIFITRSTDVDLVDSLLHRIMYSQARVRVQVFVYLY